MIEPLWDPFLCLGSAVDEERVAHWIMDRRIDGPALLQVLPRRLLGFATW